MPVGRIGANAFSMRLKAWQTVHARLLHPRRRQGRGTNHIASRVDAWHSGAVESIDVEHAALPGRQTRRGEVEVGSVAPSAGRDEDIGHQELSSRGQNQLDVT